MMKFSVTLFQGVKISALAVIFTLTMMIHSVSADTLQEIEKRNVQGSFFWRI